MVLTDDKDYLKVIADARLKLRKDAALALPCSEKEDSRGKPQATTGVGCDGFHPRVPLDLSKEARAKVVKFFEQ